METDYTLQVKAWNCFWSNLGLYYHFLPSDPKDLICRPNSELSERIIKPLYLKPRYSSPVGLCSCGIALHGLQDTYSHQNWIGKFSRHNVLPAWSKERLTLNIIPPYGHSPMLKIPDVANATWYDPRSGETIVNLGRTYKAIEATAQVLGGCDFTRVWSIFQNEPDYDKRKKALRDLAGMSDLSFASIRAEMWKRHKVPFMQAAKAQAKIVKEYLDGD